MDTKHYTYLHRRNDTNAVFYIGKGSAQRHQDTNSRNRWWKHIADKSGFTAEILAQWPDEQSAFSHERLLIQCFRDMQCELVNQTDGGEGFSGGRHTAESRARIAEASRAAEWTPERRAAHRASLINRAGHPNPMRGKTKADNPNLSRSGVKKGNIPWNKGLKLK